MAEKEIAHELFVLLLHTLRVLRLLPQHLGYHDLLVILEAELGQRLVVARGRHSAASVHDDQV